MVKFGLKDAVRTFKDSAVWRGYRRYLNPALSVGLGAADWYVSENKGAALTANVASIATTFAFRKSTGFASLMAPAGAYIGGRVFGEGVFGSTGQDKGVGSAVQSAIDKKTRVAKAVLGPGALEDPNPHISPSYNQAQDIPAYELARASSLGVSENELFRRMSKVSYPSNLLKASAQAGTALHMIEEKRMRASGQAVETERFVYDPKYQIGGHIDVIEAGNVPADVKTVSRNVFEKLQQSGTAKQAHIGQVQFYMHAMGADTGRLHYIMREDPSQRISMEFDYDPELMQYNLDKLQRVRASIKMGLSAGFLKEKLPRTASLETLLAYERQDHPEYSMPELQEIFGEEMEWLSRVKSNKAVNAFKGHDAGRWGRETTFASGDFKPGSSWIGLAIKKGVPWQKIGATALGESTGFAGAAFGAHLKGVYAQQGLEATVKAARGAMGISAGERRFMVGKLIDKGSYKSVYEAYEIGRGAVPGKKFAYAESLAPAPEYLSSTPFLRTGAAGAIQGKLDIDRVKKFTEVFEKSMTAHSAGSAGNQFAAEIKAQQMARKAYGSQVPEVIGATDRGFVQEFAGKQLPDSHIESVFRAAQKHYKEVLSQTGTRVVHYDLHGGNILRRGGKTTIIDWGFAAPTKVTERFADTGNQMMKLFKSIETGEGTAAGYKLLASLETPGNIIKKLSSARLKSDTDKLKKLLEQQDNPFVLEKAASVERSRRSRFNTAGQAAQRINPIHLHKYRRNSHGKNG